MPMKLTIGLAKKVGLPRYGSLGASCGVELEAPDPGEDPDGFRRRVRAAFLACTRSVEEELARHRPPPEGSESGDTAIPTGDPPGGPLRPATGSQVRALRALCRRGGVDLDALMAARSGADGPESLSAAEAGRLIDELQRTSANATA